MRKITKKELKTILENHKHWLNEDCEGWECIKADLSDADLSDTNLIYADLRYANLSCANLSNANLNNANLSYADLSCTKLSCANLSNANLNNANLRDANLSYTKLINANLTNTNLFYATLLYANLSCAKLINANLTNTNLCCSNLRHADLKSTNLTNATLMSAINVPYIPMICPEDGAFIGYKKTKDGIVKLEILSDARRSSATGRKCRCDKAKVLGIYDENKNLLDITETVSNHDPNFVYKVGEVVEEPNFCKDRWDECAEGIHFFMSFYEAAKY